MAAHGAESGRTLQVRVPAKINLHLEVVGRRPDGFHELRTIFQSVDLHDTLEATTAGEGRLDLVIEPEGTVDAGPTNLVIRAARALWSEVGARPGAALRLHKRIPVGGGMGGGSADAAAALVLLDRLWGTDLPDGVLRRIAADLGSDVPFFLHGGLAIGFGRGEEVVPLDDLPAMGVLLILPECSVSTPVVFSKLRAESWKRMDDTVYAGIVRRPPEIRWSAVENDLERVVCEGWPLVARALEAVRRLDPMAAAVSGSGSAVFGVFQDLEAANAAASKLDGPWRREAVTMVGRSGAKPVAVPQE